MTGPLPMTTGTPEYLLCVGADMRDGGIVQTLGAYEIAIYSACSPHRSVNQDAAAVFRLAGGGLLLLVADGMGGMPRGAHASALLIEHIRQAVLAADTVAERGLRERLIEAIDAASRRIRALGVGAGSTLAAVEIRDGALRSIHVGDSMVLVAGKRGRIKLQTVSHSPVGYAVEAGLLNEDDALHHHERNVVSNMVGFPRMHIELGPCIDLAAQDTVLLASDGLFDNLYIEEIVGAMRRGSLADSMATLAAATRRRMEGGASGRPCKPDDLTFILLRRSRSAASGRESVRRG